jgi:hypothetical protein
VAPEYPRPHPCFCDWRDEVPRVVVSFGCGNNVSFDSASMEVEQSD